MRQLVKMSASLVSIRHADNYGKKREKKRRGVGTVSSVSVHKNRHFDYSLFVLQTAHPPRVPSTASCEKGEKKNEHYVCF